jgi:hypothetical protein
VEYRLLTCLVPAASPHTCLIHGEGSISLSTTILQPHSLIGMLRTLMGRIGR